MPSLRVTNLTNEPLNISLKQVTALHFENTVLPGQTIKLKPGKVWFTFEALLDTGPDSRYSLMKSAATIALISIAVAAAAATAGAALLPEAVAVGSGAVGMYLAKGLTVTKGALVAHSGKIAKISSMALPKAIERVSNEVGGLTALQREVLSIVSSPTLSSDVRHKAVDLLKSLKSAHSKGKAPASAEAGSASIKELDDDGKEIPVETEAVQTPKTLRVHKIYMDQRRHFEVRRKEGGEMELWDVDHGRIIS